MLQLAGLLEICCLSAHAHAHCRQPASRSSLTQQPCPNVLRCHGPQEHRGRDHVRTRRSTTLALLRLQYAGGPPAGRSAATYHVPPGWYRTRHLRLPPKPSPPPAQKHADWSRTVPYNMAHTYGTHLGLRRRLLLLLGLRRRQVGLRLGAQQRLNRRLESEGRGKRFGQSATAKQLQHRI